MLLVFSWAQWENRLHLSHACGPLDKLSAPRGASFSLANDSTWHMLTAPPDSARLLDIMAPHQNVCSVMQNMHPTHRRASDSSTLGHHVLSAKHYRTIDFLTLGNHAPQPNTTNRAPSMPSLGHHASSAKRFVFFSVVQNRIQHTDVYLYIFTYIHTYKTKYINKYVYLCMCRYIYVYMCAQKCC